MSVSAYPLQWPEGWPRTPESKRSSKSPFVTTFDKARKDLQAELARLGAKGVVISTWLPLRQDGNPRSDFARYRIEDPGVAVYFELKKRPMVMARDAFWNIHDNLRSIGLAVKHMRGMERHGGGAMMERMFEGFAALPAPGSVGWRAALGNLPDLETAKAVYRQKAMDVQNSRGRGLSDQEADAQLVQLNSAMREARDFFFSKGG